MAASQVASALLHVSHSPKPPLDNYNTPYTVKGLGNTLIHLHFFRNHDTKCLFTCAKYTDVLGAHEPAIIALQTPPISHAVPLKTDSPQLTISRHLNGCPRGVFVTVSLTTHLLLIYVHSS